MNRRIFLKTVGVSAVSVSLAGCADGFISNLTNNKKNLNIVLIVADDLSWDSVGCFGSKVEAITPNLDALASEGMRLEKAHTPVAVCMPCRQALLTGRYPHHNGALGFDPINLDVPTLVEVLRRQK